LLTSSLISFALLEEVERYQTDTGVRDKTDPKSIETAQQVAENMKNASDYFGDSAFQSSYEADSGTEDTGTVSESGSYSQEDAGGSFAGEFDPGFKQGGLAKRKPKVKNMKRGGLASR
jgi:hypothetical protein